MNKYRIAYLVTVAVWFLFVVALLIHGRPRTEAEVSEPQPQPEPPVAVRVIPKPIVATVDDTAAEVEAVPMERDPVREDIPLSAENQRLLWQACEETGVVYELALAVIWNETDFRNIVGDSGKSFGYMQIQKRWHTDRMERHGVTDLMDPYGNFLVGCDYLAELAGKDRGLEWTLMAYNGGPSYANKMTKAGKVSRYVKDVLNYMNILTTEEI